ncbi:MAG TPA: hypothetical protein PLI47_02145 [Bacteroidia bacterium]|nr:hypothetical protein [Bacteroidota bacterium]MBP9789756.1 hypothetical protein [Bacteroidia bacterium]MBK8586921.1 hypothetical protein [Bacteroidota bacterium]MBP9923897.1 hypothetical protein [Bacteroidia bacterium]HQV99384.1 hypothetical protein [Bacteroidia bacterium]
MWFHYFLVFLGAFIFDVVPFPFPPAFTIMVTLQILFDLNIWLVIIIGVAGSILGRYILTLYIPHLAGRIFKRAKTEDIEFLGTEMKERGWRSHVFILAYSLMPLPTTPLFLAAGIAKVKPINIIPAFFIGKFISDTIAVFLGKYATENSKAIFENVLTWKSTLSLAVGLIMIGALLFIDWRTLIQKNKLEFDFRIWK